MTQTERTDASISSTPSSGSPLAYPSLAAFEAHLGALGAKPAHLRRICRAWLGSASAAWPDALGAEAEQPARSRAARLPAALMVALADIRSRLDAVLTVRSRHPGADPESERLLLTLADGQTIEEVLLPRRGVCVQRPKRWFSWEWASRHTTLTMSFVQWSFWRSTADSGIKTW